MYERFRAWVQESWLKMTSLLHWSEANSTMCRRPAVTGGELSVLNEKNEMQISDIQSQK